MTEVKDYSGGEKIGPVLTSFANLGRLQTSNFHVLYL